MSKTRIAYVETGEVRPPKLGEFCEMSPGAKGGVAVASVGWEIPRRIYRRVEIPEGHDLAGFLAPGFAVTRPDGTPVDGEPLAPAKDEVLAENKVARLVKNADGERVIRVTDGHGPSNENPHLPPEYKQRLEAEANSYVSAAEIKSVVMDLLEKRRQSEQDVARTSAIASGMLANQVFLDGLTAHHAEITKAERDAGTAPDFDLAATVAAEAVRVVDEIKKLVANR